MLTEKQSLEPPLCEEPLARIIAFLSEIGIKVKLAQDEFDSFLPGVKI